MAWKGSRWMPKKFHQYSLTQPLSKKYSHATYLASPTHLQGEHGELEPQVVLTIFTQSLFRFPHEREKLLQKAQHIKEFEYQHLLPLLDIGIEEEQPFVVRQYLLQWVFTRSAQADLCSSPAIAGGPSYHITSGRGSGLYVCTWHESWQCQTGKCAFRC